MLMFCKSKLFSFTRIFTSFLCLFISSTLTVYAEKKCNNSYNISKKLDELGLIFPPPYLMQQVNIFPLP